MAKILPAYNIICSYFKSGHGNNTRPITQHDGTAYLITVCQLSMLRNSDTTFEDCFASITYKGIRQECMSNEVRSKQAKGSERGFR